MSDCSFCISGGTADITNASNFAGTLNIAMLAFDPAQGAITFAYNFTPSANFLGTDPEDEETNEQLKHHTLFVFGSQVIPQFSRGTETYGSQTRFSNPYAASGIYAFYPQDEYKLNDVSVICKFSNSTDEELKLTPRTSPAVAPKCAFGLNIRNTLSTFFKLEVSDTTGSTANPANGVSYELSVRISRPVMFQLYPSFVIAALWLIIIFEFLLIFCLSFFEFRKVSLPFPPDRHTGGSFVRLQLARSVLPLASINTRHRHILL